MHNHLPLWDMEHSSRNIWATFLDWSYCVTADEPPTTLITTPEIVVTLHDYIDHEDTAADDLANWLLSTEWRPRPKTLSLDADEDSDAVSHNDQRDGRPPRRRGQYPPSATTESNDNGCSSSSEMAERSAAALTDRKLNPKNADIISAVDWEDDK